MRIGTTAVSVTMGCAVMAVFGMGVATASNGQPVLLGHTNKATATTTVKSSGGTPLSLKGPSSAPPLAVSSSKQVSKLNASLLGGKSAAQIEAAGGGTITQVIAAMSQGFGVALCPAGTKPIGGGVLPDISSAADDDAAYVVASYPDLSDTSNTEDGWAGGASDVDGTYPGGGVVFAYCSDGKVAGENPGGAALRRAQAHVKAAVRR